MKSTAIASSESIRVVMRYGAPLARSATGAAKMSRRKSACVQTGVKTPSASASTSSRNSSLHRSSSRTSHSNASVVWDSTDG